jgi:hypothetical protein
LVVDNQLLYVAGGGASELDENGTKIGTYSEVKGVSVLDIIGDKEVVWKHRAKLPKPALLRAYSPLPLTMLHGDLT